MPHSLKFLGLIVAMSALLVSPAAAKQFHSGTFSGSTYVTGTQAGTNQFDLANGANVKCSAVKYDGSYSGSTTSDLTLTPTFSSCLSSGQTTTIETGGCAFTILTPSGSGDAYTAFTQFTCPAGKSLVIKVGDPVVACTVTISAQTPSGTINLFDETAFPGFIALNWWFSTFTYTSTGSVCGPNGSARFTGEVLLKGYEDAAHANRVAFLVF